MSLQVGFVSMEPKTGYVTALIGGRIMQKVHLTV